MNMEEILQDEDFATIVQDYVEGTLMESQSKTLKAYKQWKKDLKAIGEDFLLEPYEILSKEELALDLDVHELTEWYKGYGQLVELGDKIKVNWKGLEKQLNQIQDLGFRIQLRIGQRGRLCFPEIHFQNRVYFENRIGQDRGGQYFDNKIDFQIDLGLRFKVQFKVRKRNSEKLVRLEKRSEAAGSISKLIAYAQTQGIYAGAPSKIAQTTQKEAYTL